MQQCPKIGKGNLWKGVSSGKLDTEPILRPNSSNPAYTYTQGKLSTTSLDDKTVSKGGLYNDVCWLVLWGQVYDQAHLQLLVACKLTVNIPI